MYGNRLFSYETVWWIINLFKFNKGNEISNLVDNNIFCFKNLQGYLTNDDTFNFMFGQVLSMLGNYTEAEEVCRITVRPLIIPF